MTAYAHARRLHVEIDGSTHETTIREFLRDNADGVPWETLIAIRKLQPCQSYTGGGGAGSEWRVTRIA